MELVNTNEENSFNPTPKLKSSPIPITFVSFNENDKNCIYCGDKYIKARFSYEQRYCKKCLLLYITDITNNDSIFLDVYFHTRNLECNEHEISRTKEPRNVQECCKNCLEILLFKQIPEYSIQNNYDPSYTNTHNRVIESEKYCKLCGKLLYCVYSTFKLCSDCYRISLGYIESTLTNNYVPIIYLPWWHNISLCIFCKSKLISTSDCQKYCAHCFIFYTGCRYCLTTNIIFGLADQSQCKKCKRVLFIINLSRPSNSGNSDLDDFLLNFKLNIHDLKIAQFSSIVKNINKFFEPSYILKYVNTEKVESIIRWIPYFQFTDVVKIAKGGFGTIYRATWSNRSNRSVVLKRYENSRRVSKYFLNELKANCVFYNRNKNIRIIKIYGITKDPESEDYMLVMEYASSGDLHNYLQRNFTEITWINHKLDILRQISKGLRTIHNAELIHRDLHSGNILFDYQKNQWKIGDLGFLQPADNTSPNNEIYGVIPYIAPEIFDGSAFSKESDIYSMGMIMWELTTGCKPFANVEHDIHLIYKIHDGLRPKITEDTPKCYAELMESCWNPDPNKRPSITEICKALHSWCRYDENVNVKQFFQADIKRIRLINSKMLGPKFTEKPHSDAIYTSRPLSFFISKCLSINPSSIISFDNKQDYISKELEIDIDIESSNLQYFKKFSTQNSLTIQHSNKIHTIKVLDMSVTSLGKRKIEELNFENHDNGKRIKFYDNSSS
ncbi:kinase-like domain-containing protein [Glomus cerebriforme]|uniref:Kinase-like domain-containing protein n=1 Tax=Glomus cerebriforme TaxID=658196 RepID=A0A397T6I9_9GLOM|nr:kinase-like domain-containing protein [Glomus cerebriforme]